MSAPVLAFKGKKKQAQPPIVKKVLRLLEVRPHVANFLERIIEDLIEDAINPPVRQRRRTYDDREGA